MHTRSSVQHAKQLLMTCSIFMKSVSSLLSMRLSRRLNLIQAAAIVRRVSRAVIGIPQKFLPKLESILAG